jgi:hypothetical protein
VLEVESFGYKYINVYLVSVRRFLLYIWLWKTLLVYFSVFNHSLFLNYIVDSY